MLAVMDTHVMDGDDVRMLEQSGGGNLTAEPLNDLLARELPRQNHFQRNDALETKLACPINYSHPATRNFFKQFVVAKAMDRLVVGQGTAGIRGRICYRGRGRKFRFKVVGRRPETASQQAASAEPLCLAWAQFGPAPRA